MAKKIKRNGRNPAINSDTMLQLTPKLRAYGANSKSSDTRVKFLFAFEVTNGNISAACAYAGIGRKTYYRWMESSSRINRRFQQKIKDIRPIERQLDIAELVLNAHLENGSLKAAEIVLKSPRGRVRGYNEQQKQSVEFDLIVRAVERIEKTLHFQKTKHPDWEPNLQRFYEIAANEFGVNADEIEREYLKRQPKTLDVPGVN